MLLTFTEDAWTDYCYWQNQDRKTLKRINKLIKDIQRDPFSGIGKPEPLKYDFQGAWSRRIDAENRLIYMIDGKSVYLLKIIIRSTFGRLFYFSENILKKVKKDQIKLLTFTD